MARGPDRVAADLAGAAPLVLASRSESRRALLSAAGLEAEFIAPDVDERAVEEGYLARGGSLEDVALELAEAKALAAAQAAGRLLHRRRSDAYARRTGSSTSPSDFAEAAQTLALLSGKTHRLTSAFCVARAGKALVVHRDHADVRMRALDPGEISRYLERAGPSVLASVGAYQGEGLGVHLFERIEGDHSVVLGLPMLSLLAWLRPKI